MPGRVIVPKIVEDLVHPWGPSQLSLNGVGYSAVSNANADGTFANAPAGVANSYPVPYPGYWGDIKYVDVGLTFSAKCDNGDAMMRYYVEGRELMDVGRPWVTLSSVETQNRPFNAAWAENTIQGRLLPQTNFNTYPFELRVATNVNTVAINQVKMKSSSYVFAKYVIGRD